MRASFNVNVPLYVEVGDDGRVTFDVDLSQVDIEDDDDAVQKHLVVEREQIELFVQAACTRLGNHFQFSNPAKPQEAS